MSDRSSRKSLFHAPPTVNIVLDVISALLFASLITTGTLLEWRLPHGSGHGRNGAATWLGLGRHEWGEVHFWLALSAVAVILVHVVLHWAWIRSFWPKLVRAGSAPLGALTLLAIATLIVTPFVVPVSVDASGSQESFGPGARRGDFVSGVGRGREIGAKNEPETGSHQQCEHQGESGSECGCQGRGRGWRHLSEASLP